MKKNLFLIVLAGIIGGIFYTNKPKQEVTKVDTDMLFTVAKENMTIGILSSGAINARKNHKVVSEVTTPCKIAWIIAENSLVKKGDVLVIFDDEELLTQLDNSKLEYENSIKELEIALEELTVLKSSNLAELKSAGDAVVTAEDAYYKYIKLEGPKAKEEQQLAVEEALKAYEDAQETYNKAIAEHKVTVYDTEEESASAEKNIDNLEKAVSQKERTYDNVLLNRKIFKRYDYPNRISSLENALEQSKLNLQKVKISCQSVLVQKENSIISIKNRIQRNKTVYDKNIANSKVMKLYAPSDGVVIYGDATNNRWGGKNIDLKVGTEVHRGEVMITIPDMSSMLVEFDMPEIFRSRVEVGNEAIITVEALQSFRKVGKLSKIALLPVNQIFWDQNSPKIYKSEIELVGKNDHLVSGMSVQIEIVTQTLKNVLAIPIEAIFEEAGEYFVYVYHNNKPLKRKVKLGISNETKVLVNEGLFEGNVIYLFNPYIAGK